ncbi:Alpha/Beta hydrolase protein [Dunaliella salina]|uniref:Alpha/Beta hydrolase protein n=1 Tax=Dunaliella salina TaxID=3046 RepID=A0ABQ7G0P4_DUNSA|nr:Alpha/Beta hydrolase protein [Dunaliella salina]|eukprot:KAF5828180.1 Alpha/Beta hydrolase protein [Dunaliella salina]
MAPSPHEASLFDRVKQNALTPKNIFQGLVLGLLAFILTPRSEDIVEFKPFQRELGDTKNTINLHTDAYSRTNVLIPSASTTENTTVNLAAWLYEPSIPPDAAAKPPIVVMAHGLGGQRDFGLHKYADAYARNGFAALVFDYRGFGGSDGEPRQLVSPQMQLEDWEAAITYTQSTELAPKVDASRLLLWGTSYSGGHVLVTASKLGEKIKAVVAQVPFLGARHTGIKSTKTRGLSASIRLLMAGIADKLASMAGKSPMYVKLAGSPGEVAFMAMSPEELHAYKAKQPAHKQGGWRNMVPARFVFEAPRYNPLDYLGSIKSPVMLISAAQDALCPHEVVAQAAAQLPGSELVTLDCDHFSLYLEKNWEYTIKKQLEFMRKHASEEDALDLGSQKTEKKDIKSEL